MLWVTKYLIEEWLTLLHFVSLYHYSVEVFKLTSGMDILCVVFPGVFVDIACDDDSNKIK